MYMCYCPEMDAVWNWETNECTQCLENQYPNYATFTCDCVENFVPKADGGCMPVPTEECSAVNFFLDPVTNECIQCNAICATCSESADNCTACVDDLRTNYEPGRARDSYNEPPTGLCPYCREERQMANDGTCFHCEQEQENCKSCDANKICSECKKHWIQDPNGACIILACEAGYVEYTDSANVTGCHLDTDVLECGTNAVEVNGACVVCDSSCVAGHCTGPEATDCTACKVNGAQLSGTPALCLCPAGTYLDTTDTAGDRCLYCNEDCATCYGPSHFQCVTCNTDYTQADPAFYEGVGFCTCKQGYEYNEQFDLCVQTCQDAGTYFVDYNVSDRSAFCRDCPNGTTCAACARDTSGTVNCTACAANFIMNSYGECQCETGYTKYEADQNGNEIATCGTCDDRCTSCYGPAAANCYECNVQGNAEMVTQTERIAGDADTVSISICQCKHGYHYDAAQNGCVFSNQASTNCAALHGCEFCNEEEQVCLQCYAGYEQVWLYQSDTLLDDQQEPAIIYSCYCDDPRVELSLTNGGKQCIECHSTCMPGQCTGDSEHDCNECVSDRQLVSDDTGELFTGGTRVGDYSCECKERFIDDEDTGECVFEQICEAYSEDPECVCADIKCVPGYCLSTGCEVCYPPFEASYNGYCECPAGSYEFYESGVDEAGCRDCHDSCETCIEGGQFDCVTCSHGMTLSQVPEGLMCSCNGFWNEEEGECYPVMDSCSNADCETCIQRNSIETCIKCYADHQFIENGQCVDCVFPCEVCENRTTCRSCDQTANWLDPYGIDQFLVYDYGCYCPMGTMRNQSWDAIQNSSAEYCASCGDMCGGCYDNAAFEIVCSWCTDPNAEPNGSPNPGCGCKAGFQLEVDDNGATVSPQRCQRIPDDNQVCSDWEYQSGTECYTCPDYCLSCEMVNGTQVVCVECPVNATTNDAGMCECRATMTMAYEQISTQWYEFTNPYCVACSANCNRCDSQDPEICYECATGYSQSAANGLCDVCAAGYVSNTQGVGEGE